MIFFSIEQQVFTYVLRIQLRYFILELSRISRLSYDWHLYKDYGPSLVHRSVFYGKVLPC